MKSPLKVQNGVQETASPVKKVVKRSRQILDSDDDEPPIVKEQVPKKDEVKVTNKEVKVTNKEEKVTTKKEEKVPKKEERVTNKEEKDPKKEEKQAAAKKDKVNVSCSYVDIVLITLYTLS